MEASRLDLPHGLPAPANRSAHAESWSTQLRWFGAAAVVGFAVPYLGSSVLELQHDLYLAIYFAAVLALCGAYVRSTGLDVRATLLRHWKLGSLLGLVFGVALVRNVLSKDATPRPDGAYFVFELIWRGGIYGAIDALLLTVLPCLIVYRSLGGRLATWRRRLAYFGASLALVMTITAVYHLGYSQYREEGVVAPETGNMIISMPMLLSSNPIGSVVDHATMHVSAVAHSYETDVRLPPPTKADSTTASMAQLLPLCPAQTRGLARTDRTLRRWPASDACARRLSRWLPEPRQPQLPERRRG
jgi:hypothetical protein